MQFNTNINNKTLLKINKEGRFKLNLIHGAIVDFFAKIYSNPKFQFQIINNDKYVYLNYDKVITELPLLDIGKKSVQMYINTLVNANILKKEIVNYQYTYFAPGERFGEFFSDSTEEDFNKPKEDEEPKEDDNKPEKSKAYKEIKTAPTGSTLTIEGIKEHPTFSYNRSKKFPNLTDEEVDGEIGTFLSSYPKAKIASVFNYLADADCRLHKKQNNSTQTKYTPQNSYNKSEEPYELDGRYYYSYEAYKTALKNKEYEERENNQNNDGISALKDAMQRVKSRKGLPSTI